MVPDTQSFPPAVQFFSPMDFSVRVTGELICFVSIPYSLAVSLFVCLFVGFSVPPVYLCLSVVGFLSFSLCLCLCLSVCLSVCRFLCPPQFMSVCLLSFFCFVFCRSLCVSVSLSVCLSASLSPSVYVGLCVPGFLSLSVSLKNTCFTELYIHCMHVCVWLCEHTRLVWEFLYFLHVYSFIHALSLSLCIMPCARLFLIIIHQYLSKN